MKDMIAALVAEKLFNDESRDKVVKALMTT